MLPIDHCSPCQYNINGVCSQCKLIHPERDCVISVGITKKNAHCPIGLWSNVKTSIFIRSYVKDYPWLAYCLQSIKIYCKDFAEIILVVPLSDLAALPDECVTLCTHLYTVKEHTHGYIAQQVTKLNAYKYTSSDRVLFVDSDCIFHTPCTPLDFPSTILYTPYKYFAKDEQARCWQKITSDALGFQVENEYMRRIPLQFHRSTLESLATAYPRMIAQCHTIQSNAFSEFNVMGAFAHRFEPTQYKFEDTTLNPLPPSFARQYWSWGGLTPEIEKEIQNVLMA